MTGLDPRLAADCIRLGRFELCHLLLMNDSSYPWFILVPQLHLHHVVRFKSDRAWPSPVWGRFPAVAYGASAVADIRRRLAAATLPGFVASYGD